MKTVVITGAGSGIGAATAALFSSHGYRCILVGRNVQRLNELAKTISQAQVEACEIQNPQERERLAKNLAPLDIDVLVNNAGIIHRQSFLDVSSESLREQFETNFFAPFHLTQLILPQMIKKQSGAVVNVASTLGMRPVAATSAYSASKAAMINWTQALALETAQYGLRINAICPGIVDTPILTGHSRTLTEQEREHLGKLHPVGRLGSPAEIAEAIFYLATARWTTGACLVVDGGISLTQN